MSLIASTNFVDLILGQTYCDVKNLEGAASARVSAPVEWATEVDALRQQCKDILKEHGDPEFVCTIGGSINLRVTHMLDVNQQDVFFIRRTNHKIFRASDIGLPRSVLEAWRAHDLRGLVLITGEMGNGKTATAASLIVDRLEQGGGLAIALEDPLETNLDGIHGERSGRCVQVQASRKTGGFKEHLIKTMRTGSDLIFVGEIRDGDTAEQAAIGALNGHLMIATMHANSPSSAIERFITLAKSGSSAISNIEDIVAAGLSIVVTQSLTRVPGVGSNGKSITRLSAQHLILTGPDGLGIREKIRSGKSQSLTQDVDQQSRQSTYGIKN
jgi:twitching motility protein PilT